MNSVTIYRRLLSGVIKRRREVESSRPNDPNAWTLGPGVVLLDKPEMRCPYCGEGFQCDRTYLVNTRRNRVAFAAKGGSWVPNSEWHPHVSGTSICMGNAPDALTALTMGLNHGNGYIDVGKWVLEQGHDCPNNPSQPRVYCSLCGQAAYMRECSIIDSGGYACVGCTTRHLRECESCHVTGWPERMVRRSHDSDVLAEPWVWFHNSCVPEGLSWCAACETVFDADTIVGGLCLVCRGGE